MKPISLLPKPISWSDLLSYRLAGIPSHQFARYECLRVQSYRPDNNLFLRTNAQPLTRINSQQCWCVHFLYINTHYRSHSVRIGAATLIIYCFSYIQLHRSSFVIHWAHCVVNHRSTISKYTLVGGICILRPLYFLIPNAISKMQYISFIWVIKCSSYYAMLFRSVLPQRMLPMATHSYRPTR